MIYDHLVRELEEYQAQLLSLEELRERTASRLSEALDSADSTVIELSFQVQALIIELDEEVVTSEDFEEEVSAIIRMAHTLMVSASQEPRTGSHPMPDVSFSFDFVAA